MKFTRRDLPVLVRMGMIPEDASTELLDGMILLTDRSAVGEDILRVGRSHRITVERLSRLSQVLDTQHRHVETLQPLNCEDTQEPEPDFMVVEGKLDDLDEDYPAAAHAFCVAEVSDGSYEKDSREKLACYARAGIPQYIIINLRNRTAEVYTQPEPASGKYTLTAVVDDQGTLALRVGESDIFPVAMAEILP
jgi:Uma2 family endonuclease